MIKTNLSFATLRKANTLRLPLFKNAQGKPAHADPDGSDWSLGTWMNALFGELGEAANIVKKLRRGDFVDDMQALKALADEFADIVIYADIISFRLNRPLVDYPNVNNFTQLRDVTKAVATSSYSGYSLPEVMNKACGAFGIVAMMIDSQRDLPEVELAKSTRSAHFTIGITAIDTAASFALQLDLGDWVARKFNTVSQRVGADVFISIGDMIVNGAGEQL